MRSKEKKFQLEILISLLVRHHMLSQELLLAQIPYFKMDSWIVAPIILEYT